MDIVKRNRRALKFEFNRIEGVIAPFDLTNVMPLTDIENQEKALGNSRLEFHALVKSASAAATSDAEFDAEMLEFTILSEKMDKICVKLTDMKKTYAKTAASSAPTGTADVKLPKIEIPPFKGDTQEWLSFQDLFISSIHNNMKLSGSQKLQYLKGLLHGEPASLIKDIQVTDLNYATAWDILKNRYEVKRDIIRSHFDKLLTLQSLNQANPVTLRRIGDATNECSRALDVLALTPEQKWDSLVIHVMSRKLDSDSRMEWEKKLSPNEVPTITKFTDFILSQARATAAGDCKFKSNKSYGNEKKHVNFSSQEKSAFKSCQMCHENHPLYKCSKFLEASVDDRWALVKKSRLCFNCFRSHSVQECTSNFTCRNCKKKHNTLLHPVKNVNATKEKLDEKDEAENNANVASLYSHAGGSSSQVLLSTAIILVKDSRNEYQSCRALLDDGSQGSFITSKCATKLGLPRRSKVTNIFGVGGISAGRTTQSVQLQFSSHHSQDKSFCVEANIKESLTGCLPTFPIQNRNWPHIESLMLADPNFYKPSKIDILLGRDIYDELVLSKKRKGPSGTPTARHTTLGWILGGPTNMSVKSNKIVVNHVCYDLDTTLQRFWELEEIPIKKELSTEENECELHFQQTHERDAEGRFVVSLPFKKEARPLGESRCQALRRLISGERSRSKTPGMQEEYNKEIQGYLDSNHMEIIPSEELCKTEKVYYIPHHAVYKPTSTTTKIRPVFDASAKSSNGVSLNDNLLIGPKLQDDLFNILVRFRTHIVAFTADVAKMYRQVCLKKEDYDFHRILWRSSTEEPIKEYRLTTATFGTAAAPYLAIKCLQQLGAEEIKNSTNGDDAANIKAANKILSDFYVDDIMSGANTEEEAIVVKNELIRILEGGKMQLRKWSSNSNSLLSSLPAEFRETKFPLQIDSDESVKTLGLTWNPASDMFMISVVLPPSRSTITKRSLLSDLAKTFDPLGLLAPATIKAKIIFQSLWKDKQDWDEPIPEHSKNDWLSYLEDFPAYDKINIPRCVIVPKSNYELHGFCDASQVAYAACVYLRSVTVDAAQSNLIAAKTKVAPIKFVSLARLELCGAALLASLMESIKNSLNLSISKIFYWTDSTIVLAWISSPSQRWKIFVANKVAKIQEKSSSNQWRHVRGKENPADCASRGINPSDLSSHKLWWHGPEWLKMSLELAVEDPVTTSGCDEFSIGEEERKNVLNHHISTNSIHKFENIKISRFSNFMRMLKATAYMNRCFHQKSFKKAAAQPISCKEINSALEFWIKQIQNETFSETIAALKEKTTVGINKQLLSLSPFIDANGILRVGGRLQNSVLSPDRKHPILLSKKNHFTLLIVEYYHRTYLHAGNQLLLSMLQKKFWILGARDVIRSQIRKCVTCFRVRAETAQQMMGNLPAPRVLKSRPFQQVGVDFAGPFSIYLKRGRGQKPHKTYVAVFVCFVVRAIHLELVSDLTSEAFLAAFRRFVSRRGLCSNVYSDCGSNFVGANNELKTYMKNIQASTLGNQLKDVLANDGITWHFNPPSAPHQGGLWEAGVKSFKYHLKRIVGGYTLSMEEMLTVLAQIEACLNSRPLTALSTDPEDLTALTPGHFLVGDALLAIPEPDVTHLQENRLSRWQLMQRIYQQFWNRWSSEYLSRLQQRPKWWSEKKNMSVGDLVLLKDERYPSLMWKLGRITELFPGKDKLVRVVSVKTIDGIYKRPIVKLCPLPLDN